MILNLFFSNLSYRRLFCEIIRISLFLVVSLISGSCFAQDFEFVDNNDIPNKFIELNKITKDETYTYNLDKMGNIIDSVLFGAEIYLYDNNGKVKARQMLRIKDLVIDRKTDYYYNQSGQIVKSINYVGFKSKPLKISFSREYGYDSVKRHVYTYLYNSDTTHLSVIKKIYDDTGRLVKVLFKSDNKPFVNHNLLYYDRLGNLSKLEFFNDKGELDHSYLFEFDNVSNIRTVSVQYGKTVYFLEKRRKNNFDQIIMRTSNAAQYTDTGHDVNAQNLIQKYIYNPDNTLYNEIIYINGSVTHIYKHVYEK